MSKKSVFMRDWTTFVLLYHIPQFFSQFPWLSYLRLLIFQIAMLVFVNTGDLYFMNLLLKQTVL